MPDSFSSVPSPARTDGYVRRVLRVRGRVSGAAHDVPIAVLSVHGAQFVVPPVRDRDWVRNLLANPACEIVTRDGAELRHARRIEIPAEAADVAATYISLMNAPWAVAQFPFGPDAERAQIEAVADRFAVFELHPSVTESGEQES